MEQLSLDGTSVALGRQAPRQDAVLKLLSEHPEGCSADECAIDARPILLALIRKRLVTHTASGQFTLRNDEAADASFGEFPKGF